MTYVCSDIHGLKERYDQLLKTLSFSTDDTLYIIGDMIDRGEHGIEILEDMMRRENIIPLLGNHEMFLLYAMEEKEARPKDWEHAYYARSWLSYNNGGKVTYQAFDKRNKEEQKAILDYLNQAWVQKNVFIGDKHYLLCHGSYWGALTKQDVQYLKGKPIEYPEALKDIRYCPDTMGRHKEQEQLIQGVVWNSPYRHWSDELVPLEHFAHYADITFLIGHVPVQRMHEKSVYRQGNVIDLDGGCALAGLEDYKDQDNALLCLCLENQEVITIR